MPINFPDSPSVNDQYTVGDRTWTWNGTYWQTSTSMSTFTASDSEPVDADAGDIWFDSTIGKTFINYGGTWVEIGNAATVVDVIADADADTKVQVESSADEDKIRFSTAGTERVIVDNAGNVGIGTTSPASTLEVDGAVKTGNLTVWGDGFDDTTLSVVKDGEGTGSIKKETGYVSISALNAAESAYHDVVIAPNGGNVGIGTTSPAEPLHVATTSGDAYLRQENGTATTYVGPDGSNTGLFGTSTAHDVRFITANTERMRITDDGNVGIGTTLPDYPLDVNGKAIVGGGDNQTPDAFGNGHLMIAGAGYTGFASLDGTAMWVGHNSASRNLNFAVDETARMTLDTSGRLGIGTTSPSKPLHIVYDDPTIQLTDTNTNADSIISANSSVGSLILGADENNEVGSSQIAFKVDGATLMGLQANGNLEMLGGTVKGDGALVQMVTSYSGVSDLTSSANVASITMSPKYSDSTMLVFVNYHVYKYNTTQAVNNQYQLYQSGGGNITALHNYVVYDTPSYMFQGMVSGTIAAGSTASRTYHFYVTASSSANRIYFYWKRMYVLEIAT